jgi:hypothetical protein
MPEILKKATAQIPATETCGGLSTLSAVGVGLHWGNSSSLKQLVQMDFDSN